MIKILGVATCYNRCAKTVNSLNRLRKGNPTVEFHFLIMDDNSTDGTRETLKKMENVTVLEGNGSLFYSGGMRIAIDWAQKCEEEYDYCLLFNDDVEFYPNSIEMLAQKNNSMVWVGPTCDESGQLTYGGIVKNSKYRPSVRVVRAEDKSGMRCDTFNANCVLIPWRIFCEMENIDEAYIHAMGDFDIGFNLARRGHEIRVSDEYVGICNTNSVLGTWLDVTLSRRERIKRKKSPKGLPNKLWFHYLKKEYNLATAVLYSLTPYVRILIKK